MTVVKVEQQKDACSDCHGSKVVRLDVSSTGYSVGSEIDHAILCPKRKCIHGKITWGPLEFQQECAPCEKRLAAEQCE